MAKTEREKKRVPYEKRLFSGGIRKWVHEARFKWLKQVLSKAKIGHGEIVELGCFNGKSIDYLPMEFKRYVGYDADWEGGLTEAKNKNQNPNVIFKKCVKPEEFSLEKSFDIFISLETLEHIEPQDLDLYLTKLSKSINSGGVAIISVPNEIGLIFILKTFFKVLIFRDPPEYSVNEFFFQAFNKVHKVIRHQHKGFSYKNFELLLKSYFIVEKTQGLQFEFLPRFLNISIGFVCRKK